MAVSSGIPAPEDILENTERLRHLACRNAGAGEEEKKHDCDVRHAGMAAPKENQEYVVYLAMASGILVSIK